MKRFSLRPDREKVQLVDIRHFFQSIDDGEEAGLFKPLAEIGDVGGEYNNTALAECHIVEPTIFDAGWLKFTRVSSASETKMASSCKKFRQRF